MAEHHVVACRSDSWKLEKEVAIILTMVIWSRQGLVDNSGTAPGNDLLAPPQPFETTPVIVLLCISYLNR